MTDARRGPLIASFLSMVCMGATMSLTGALLPAIVADLQLRDAQAGLLVSSGAWGYVFTAAAAGALSDRAGIKRVWVAGIALGIAALVSIALAPAFGLILPAMAALSLMAGIFDGAINPLIVRLYGARSGGNLNWVHLFFGLGATVTPFLAGVGLRAGISWRWQFGLLAIYVAAVGVAVMAARLPGPGRTAPGTGEAGAAVPWRRLLGQRVVALAVLYMLIYVGAEASMMSWTALYLERFTLVTAATASLGVSLFGAAMTVGRLLCTRLAEAVGYRRLIVGGSWLGAMGIAMMLLLPGAASPWVGVAITGLAYAGIYATVIADITPRLAGQQGAVSGLISAGGGVGMILIPWAVGQVAEARGLAVGLGTIIALSLAMGFVYLRTGDGPRSS